MFDLILKFHSYLVKACKLLQSPFLLLVRVIWGFQFFQTGKGKLMDINKVVNFFTELHIPMPKLNAYIAGSTECVGGLLLMIGLFSRLISIPLAFTMVVAYATAENDAVQDLIRTHDPEKFFAAAPFLFLFAALIVLIFGPGALSVDRIIDAFFIKGKKSKD
jgi:putative oxidoreductase